LSTINYFIDCVDIKMIKNFSIILLLLIYLSCINFYGCFKVLRIYFQKNLIAKSVSGYINKEKIYDNNPRVSILADIPDQPGSLHEILKYFWKYDIDLTRIESRPCPKYFICILNI
jgi:hypothetical protein